MTRWQQNQSSKTAREGVRYYVAPPTPLEIIAAAERLRMLSEFGKLAGDSFVVVYANIWNAGC